MKQKQLDELIKFVKETDPDGEGKRWGYAELEYKGIPITEQMATGMIEINPFEHENNIANEGTE